jgi:choline kinase
MSAPTAPLRAVILAAGVGGRLGPATAEVPKPLVHVEGRPLVLYTLEALAAAGVTEGVVVTGYLASQVRSALSDRPPLALRFVHNPHYRGGASLSLAAARGFCGADPFLLVMSDHLLSTSLLTRLIGQAREARPENGGGPPSCVAADATVRDDAFTDEATKVAVDAGGRVTAIGKHLERWDALDAGAFFCTHEVWAALGEAPEDSDLSTVFRRLVARRRLAAADVTGAFWYDVDTAADRDAAAAILRTR